MGGIPSVPTDRSRSLQVIGAGYSRTGTVSMSLALEKLLDGPVMHGGTQLLGREDAYAKLWCDIFANRHNKPVLMRLLRQATAGFVAVTDAPAATMFLPELLELYPDAKVVLVTRDPERWFRSLVAITRHTVGQPRLLLRLLLWPCPTWRWMPMWMEQMGELEKSRFPNEFTKDRLNEYNDWVRAAVPAEKLLTMELNQGWEPLAKFLNKPVPDEPFPRANDIAAADEYAKYIFGTAKLIWSGILVGTGLVAWGGLKLWGSRQLY